MGMKLSDLKTGQQGIIVKVHGHGAFRKRIIEMGFVKGKTVDVLLNAPLHDPVKYKVMGYEVSLRRQEAEMIDVVETEELAAKSEGHEAATPAASTVTAATSDSHVAHHSSLKSKASSTAPSTWRSSATPTAARRRSSTLPVVPMAVWATTAE